MSKQLTINLHNRDYMDRLAAHDGGRLDALVARIGLNATDAVVDYGCGPGKLLQHIGYRVARYVGVDLSPPAIDAAEMLKSRLWETKAEFVCTDIHAFAALHPGEFDVAFALDLSEHVSDAEWLAALASIRATLKPRGRLYVHTPNAEFVAEVMKARGVVLKQFPEHVAVRSPAANVRMLERAGFHIRRIDLIAHYNPILAWLHGLRWLPLVGKHLAARIFIEAAVEQS